MVVEFVGFQEKVMYNLWCFTRRAFVFHWF